MKVLNLNNIPAEIAGCCLAIGSFDGIHKGHSQIIEQVKQQARKIEKPSALLTFEPHPISVFRPEVKGYRITPARQKQELLEKSGLDYLIIADFDRKFASITPEDFIKDILMGKLKASHIFTGEDFTFGAKGLGNTQVLEDNAKKYGYTYHVIPKIADINGMRFSSTKVREFIVNGQMQDISHVLGRNYVISGTVEKGAGLAAGLGFKTANINMGEFVIPKFGVYECLARFDNKEYHAIANVGIKPTYGDNKPLLEVHIFGFDSDIYGKEIAVEFLKFIRDEKKFNSIEELKEQIKKMLSLSENRNLEKGTLAVILCMVFDQLHKFSMLELVHMRTGDMMRVTGFFNFVMVWNRGISFGMFQNHSYSNYIFMTTTSVICCILFYFIKKAHTELEATAFGLIIGGALGNLIDRIHIGAVADFFDFHIGSYHWPAFNIADSCVFIGAAILIISSLVHFNAEKKTEVTNEK